MTIFRAARRKHKSYNSSRWKVLFAMKKKTLYLGESLIILWERVIACIIHAQPADLLLQARSVIWPNYLWLAERVIHAHALAQKQKRTPTPSPFFNHTPAFIHRRLLVHIKHVYPHGRQPKAPAGAIIFHPPPHLLLLALMSSLILRARDFTCGSKFGLRRWRERKSALLHTQSRHPRFLANAANREM
jgi:hypothetical protein